MLVKVNRLLKDENKAKVTMLDIDDFGSIVPLRELLLRIPTNDSSITEILSSAPYAAIFTEGDTIEDNGLIVLANGITVDEINHEKSNTIKRAQSRR